MLLIRQLEGVYGPAPTASPQQLLLGGEQVLGILDPSQVTALGVRLYDFSLLHGWHVALKTRTALRQGDVLCGAGLPLTEVDAAGLVAVPGIVDMHMHIIGALCLADI